MNEATKQSQAKESKESGAPIQVDYMKNKYNQYDKDKDTNKIGIPSVVREPRKLDFSWDKVVDEKKKDTSSVGVLKEQNILALLMTASGNESGKSQYLNLVETAGKTSNFNDSKPKVEITENITKDITKNVRSRFEKGDVIQNSPTTPSKRISLIEDSSETGFARETIYKTDSNDVIKSGESSIDGDQIQKGITKNLLDQWQKNNENVTQFAAKNINENDESQSECEVIKKGTTKSLLNQWTNQTVEGSQASTPKVVQVCDFNEIPEKNTFSIDNDKVSQKSNEEKLDTIQKGSTKSLLDQWNDKKNQTYVAQIKNLVGPELKKTDEIVTDVNACDSTSLNYNKNENKQKENNVLVSTETTKNIDQSITKGGESLPAEIKQEKNQNTSLTKNDAEIESTPLEENEKEEEIDLDSLQKGLAKAMVLQWKSDHPDESLDDIIQNATKESGSYNESLIEKGIDKTLYDQWKYVKFKHLPKLVRVKKPLAINIPDKRTRPTVTQVLANRSDLDAEVPANDLPKSNENDSGQLSTENPAFSENNKNIVNQDIVLNQTDSNNTNSSKNDLSDKNKHLIENDGCIANVKTIELQTESSSFKNNSNKNIDEGTKLNDTISDDKKIIVDQIKIVENQKPEEKQPIASETKIKVSENEPKLSDKINQDNKSQDFQPVIQQGFTKQLLGQWQNKKNETVQYSKKRIIIDEDESRISENEPIEETEVIQPEEEKTINVVEKGMTKNMINQLMGSVKTDENTLKTNRIIIAETDGVISENVPVNRNDVAKEDIQLSTASDVVQQGTTKNLLGQWNKIAAEPYNKLTAERIALDIDSGFVCENEPIKRNDIVSSEIIQNNEIENIEKGFTKSLLNQWQNQNLDNSTGKSKTKVEIREVDGSIVENEPIERKDVVRSDQINEDIVIEKGYTKNILNQWQTMPSQANKSKDKTPIFISEQDGSVVENEPMQRTDVVKSGSTPDDEKITVQKGYTKSLLNQWQENKSNFTSEKKRIVIKEEDGQCVENEPIVRSGVVRASDNTDDVCVEKGYTSNLLGQWQQNSNRKSRDSSSQEKTPIIISHEDGKVSENIPVQRSDVAREGDNDDKPAHVVQQGTAKQLKSQWQNIGKQTYISDKKQSVVISEDDGRIAESQPITRTDVVKGETEIENAPILNSGITKSLVGKWNTKQTEEFVPKKETINISKEDVYVSENKPLVREDVVKADSNADNVPVVQMGTTKSLLNRWNNPSLEQKSLKKTEITISEDDGIVAENNPVAREGVVSGETSVITKEIVQKGIAKSLTSQWNSGAVITQSANQDKKVILELDSGHVAENEPCPKRSDVYREEDHKDDAMEQMPLKGQASLIKQKLVSAGQYKLESARKEPIKMFDTTTTENYIVENEPIKREGVAKEDDESFSNEISVLKVGHAKNMAGFWNRPTNDAESFPKKQPIIELDKGPAVFENDPAPSLTHNIKPVADAGVFENEPITRQDVVREADFQPEVISAHATRNIRKLWSQKENQSSNVQRSFKKPEPVRFTPPREKSPPRVVKEEFKSTHTLTFKNSQT